MAQLFPLCLPVKRIERDRTLSQGFRQPTSAQAALASRPVCAAYKMHVSQKKMRSSILKREQLFFQTLWPPNRLSDCISCHPPAQ
jgi:hypothetical protein